MSDLLNTLFDDVQEEVVDPQDEITDEGLEDFDGEGSATEPEEESEEEVATPQSREENHQFAQSRKLAEQEARQAREEAEAARRENEILRKALGGFGYTGTAQEMADALEAQRSQRSVEAVREEREAEEERIKRLVDDHPAVKAAAQMAQQAVKDKVEMELNTELIRIQKLNPEIKTLADLKTIENHQTFDTLVKGGMHIDEAYKIVHIMNEKSAPVKKDTRGHIRQMNGQSAGGAVSVPRETMEIYRALNPDATDKEIREHYARNHEE